MPFAARTPVDRLPAELEPFGPPRVELLDYERRLYADNPHASEEEVAESLSEWRHQRAAERKAERERAEALAEHNRKAAECRLCHAEPGQLRYIGTSERARLAGDKSGWVVLCCNPCAQALAAEFQRRALESKVGNRSRAELARAFQPEEGT
jgi:DNA segregation ATPase FtsK/SpoIIIE-like protein